MISNHRAIASLDAPVLFRSLLQTAVFLLISTSPVTVRAADVTLPSIFADNMVLQTDEPIVITGQINPAVEMVIELAGQRVDVNPGLFGSWEATLDPVSEPGGSHTLTISAEGETAISLGNITFGDVWLCAGQSNMEWDMTTINDSAAEIAGADFPQIRLMEVDLRTATTPRDNVINLKQNWTPCSPASVRQFSGVGYLFGREVHSETGRPIGLIQSAWGGSRIETWIPDSALQENPHGDNVLSRSFSTAQHKPSICYNGMIHGLQNLALKGVIWYQGESNESHPQEYRSLHETLITAWRDLWNKPDLPFYLVQLANYNPGTRWELLREAQTQILALSNTGMAVTIDIGNSTDIHPRNKQGTAKRLAALALANVYGQDRVYSGPLFKAAYTDGHDVIVHFHHLGTGLAGVDGGDSVTGFETLSPGGIWAKSSAMIVDDTVVVSGTLFRTNPQGVRYGWGSDPVVSLANQEGFPASPFRFESLELEYESWKDQLVGKARLPDEDANGDGTSNLMAYASAGKPPSVSQTSEGSVEVSFHRRASASDIVVILEESKDLLAWTKIWASDAPDSGSVWEEKQDWGFAMTDRHEVTLARDPETVGFYRVRYQLVEPAE